MNPATDLPDCTAGILAGGAGSRFGGQDKGWIELKGRPLVQWTLDAVRPQVRDVVISANRHLERYRALGVMVIGDRTEAADAGAVGYEGPFAGMVRLLGALRREWLLCVPCDAVRLAPDLSRRLLAAATAKGAELAVLRDAHGLHPTFCLVHASLAADALRAFDAGERAPRRWFERHRAACLDGPTPLNLNTPEALRALELEP